MDSVDESHIFVDESLMNIAKNKANYSNHGFKKFVSTNGVQCNMWECSSIGNLLA